MSYSSICQSCEYIYIYIYVIHWFVYGFIHGLSHLSIDFAVFIDSLSYLLACAVGINVYDSPTV